MDDLLANVKPEHHFLLKDGTRLKNLYELLTSLEGMDDITFNHHVNDFRNDFHSWVRDIHQDAKLASSLMKAGTREKMLKHLKQRVSQLERKRKAPAAKPAKPLHDGRKLIAEAPRKNMAAGHASRLFPGRNASDFVLGILIGIIAAIIISKMI